VHIATATGDTGRHFFTASGKKFTDGGRYEADHVYSLNTIYFFCATVGVFGIANFLAKYAPVQVKRSDAWKKVTAGLRYLAYRGYELPVVRYWSPSLGVILLGLAGTVFCFAMTLGPKPYYWPEVQPDSYGSSPPIATRTGWMALAILPFVLYVRRPGVCRIC